MKLYGGIDLHSNNSVVALLDEQDQVVYHKRLGNDAPGILAALAPYQEAIEGLVVESTYNWYWLVGVDGRGLPGALGQHGGDRAVLGVEVQR